MRWFRIRKAQIDPELRTTLEQYGAAVMQQALSFGSNFRHKGEALWVEAVRDDVLSWLTERYDQDERKETWAITMEVAVTLLVAAELVFSFYVLTKHEIPDWNSQYTLLQPLNATAADTVTAMKQLREEQTKSLESLKNEQGLELDQTNTTLSTASTAMRNQLAILRAEQRAQLEEQAKKPRLTITLAGHESITGYIPYFSADGTDSPSMLMLSLKNIGDAPATNGELIITSDPHAKLKCDCEMKRFDPHAEQSTGGMVTPFNLRSGETYHFRVTLPSSQYTKFVLFFEASANGIPYRTPIGSIRLGQRKIR